MTRVSGRTLAYAVVCPCLLLAACTPKVQVEAPKEPITINLNVKLDAEVRVKLEEQADKDIQSNPDIF
ncbi:YnbE family lipoprotein [Pelagibius sp.]|uniref:YnbE family lipoprotein n=1 Tax=Pelagibius sp. TaxID=1931238 RepID=UPI003B50B45C